MNGENLQETRDALHELIGAIDILTLLREEMEQWLEETQDLSRQETLENVVGHLAAMEEEYKRRRRILEGE
jgi:flagellar motility protein MotE (MotC chaperone)